MIIDLTRTLENNQPGVEIQQKFTRTENGWNAKTLSLYSHACTHLDAPRHFLDNGVTLDQIPLEKFMGMAHLVDITNLKPRDLIRVEHLGLADEDITEGDSLILMTGWSRHFDNADYYRDEFPRISEELARWCLENRIKMLGVEPPSVADVNNLSEVTRIHEILLSGGIVIVEGLVNLESIPEKKVHLSAIPLKIKDGDGCPCRAFVTIDRNAQGSPITQ